MGKCVYLIFLGVLVFVVLVDGEYWGNMVFEEEELNELKIGVGDKEKLDFGMKNVICN